MKLKATELKKLTDELGQLDAEISPLEAKKKQADAIRAQLREHYDAQPAEQTFALEGGKFTATIGAKGFERTIADMKRVFATVGESRFVENASMTLKKLAELLDPPTVALLVTAAPTGSRTIKTFKRSK